MSDTRVSTAKLASTAANLAAIAANMLRELRDVNEWQGQEIARLRALVAELKNTPPAQARACSEAPSPEPAPSQPPSSKPDRP